MKNIIKIDNSLYVLLLIGMLSGYIKDIVIPIAKKVEIRKEGKKKK